MKNSFHGIIVPLVTPFDGGSIDYVALKRVMESCKEGGADGFVALGTTAETPTLTENERDHILEFCLNNSGGLPVIAGASSNATSEAVRLAKRAEALGANGILSACPYYNKPPKTGIIAHFLLQAGATALPLILYNVPTRTASEIDNEALSALAGVHNIVGIKEAGNLASLKDRARFISDEFALFAGNDSLLPEAMKIGAAGFISAAANVIPYKLKEIFSLYACGRTAEASERFNKISELISALYVETNPAAIKYALYKKGLIKNELRLPMCPISHKNADFLCAQLAASEVL